MKDWEEGNKFFKYSSKYIFLSILNCIKNICRNADFKKLICNYEARKIAHLLKIKITNKISYAWYVWYMFVIISRYIMVI